MRLANHPFLHVGFQNTESLFVALHRQMQRMEHPFGRVVVGDNALRNADWLGGNAKRLRIQTKVDDQFFGSPGNTAKIRVGTDGRLIIDLDALGLPSFAGGGRPSRCRPSRCRPSRCRPGRCRFSARLRRLCLRQFFFRIRQFLFVSHTTFSCFDVKWGDAKWATATSNFTCFQSLTVYTTPNQSTIPNGPSCGVVPAPVRERLLRGGLSR